MEMMIRGSNLCLFVGLFFCSFFVFNLFFLNTTFASPSHHLCRPDQKNALLEFSNEFQTLKSKSDAFPYICSFESLSQTESWKNSSDCCSWDGVTCDVVSGFVTGLDLTCTILYGTFKPNSSLFKLNHLQILNLSRNDFNKSSIPSELGKLTMLTHLNLSHSRFSGRIPNELLQLTGLVSLDLANGAYGDLFTETPFMSALARNLRNLRELDLSSINIPSKVPKDFANMSSLRSLTLYNCNLLGEFPSDVFLFPHIESVILYGNLNLTGSLPEFPTNSSLRHLNLFFTNFSRHLPDSIGNLKSLESFSFGLNLSGNIPNSIGNLRSLRWLSLVSSDFDGEIRPSIRSLNHQWFPSDVFLLPHIEGITVSGILNLRGSLPEFPVNSSLRQLQLSGTDFCGSLPYSIANLKSLEILLLQFSNFSGNLPDSIGNLSLLKTLALGYNNFDGEVPRSIGNLNQLTILRLSDNKFSGSFSLGSLNLVELRAIDLSRNQLTVLLPFDIGINVSLTNTSSSSYFPPQLSELGLSACNITEIPSFLRTQQYLQVLDLSSNKIEGQVPEWLWKLPFLRNVNLSHNSFNHLEGSPKVLDSRNIRGLDLSANVFQGPLPIPPISTEILSTSANNFTGNIPRGICKLSSLKVLDLSRNSFTGLIPQCLGNVSDVLVMLNLRNNSLVGSLPERFIICKSLQTLDVGHNKLIGKLPRSLLNCKNLQVLNVESNRINDTFPFWLAGLLELQVLVLRSNQLHGQMVFARFSKLQVIDISHNNFFGTLPSNYFAGWSVMSLTRIELGYVGTYSPYYSLVFTNKGIEIEYKIILPIFNAIDFSGNRFQGQIPESIGHLKGLIVLNFSNNIFVGHIPRSLANLSNLESMDLSQNKLSGKIPPELGDLTYLERINFSYNQLTGTIPQGPQFVTQDSSSFEGNHKLCGRPLKETCDAHTLPAQPNQQPEPQEEVVSWIAVAIGYVPGLVFGLIIGYVVASYKHEWLLRVCHLNMRRHFRNR